MLMNKTLLCITTNSDIGEITHQSFLIDGKMKALYNIEHSRPS